MVLHFYVDCIFSGNAEVVEAYQIELTDLRPTRWNAIDRASAYKISISRLKFTANATMEGRFWRFTFFTFNVDVIVEHVGPQ
jgi:hypothetical protein